VYKIAILFSVMLIFFFINNVDAQEPKLSTFQETAQLIIDPIVSKNVTASITLQSTNNQEIRVPSELEEKIRNTDRVNAVIITNEEQCVLGVIDESCIMINISREGIEGGIFAFQDTAKEIGNLLIDDINQAFDTNAKYHSSFLHYQDDANLALETSGVISGRGTISSVFTMPYEDTFSMYQKMSSLLLPEKIRNAGGFYDVAKKLSRDENAKMTFSIIPNDEDSFYQLKLSVDYTDNTSLIKEIKPLEFFQTNELKRSEYFSDAFYPLNSLVHVIVFSNEPMGEILINTNQIPYSVIDGEKIPQDISKNGWILDGEGQTKLDGKYLFGTQSSVKANELEITIVSPTDSASFDNEESIALDESLIIIIIIVIVAGAASVFFLKGYKK